MPLTDAAKNAMLDTLAAQALFASLHSDHPGPTGANEIAGGSPAYSREAITWNAAATGNLDNDANPSFDVPPLTTVAWLGLWSAATAGTFLAWFPLGGDTPRPFEADDATNVFTADGHGLVDGTRVVVYDTSGAVLPTGVVEGTVYFVRDATTDTFSLAATSGGAVIDLTTDGAGFVQTIVPETFTGQGVYTVNDLDINLNR